MSLDASAWSNAGEGAIRQYCPLCGAGLPSNVIMSGQRLVRCRQCGQMLRRAVKWARPASDSQFGVESPGSPFNWQEATQPDFEPETPLEAAPYYPYPALQCPYCEYVNSARPGLQQFCANCG